MTEEASQAPDKAVDSDEDDGFLNVPDQAAVESEEEKKEPIEASSRRPRVGKRLSNRSIQSNRTGKSSQHSRAVVQQAVMVEQQPEVTPDADEEQARPAKRSKMPVGGWGVAQGIFKDAFEEIMEETIALSHYVTNGYRTYK